MSDQHNAKQYFQDGMAEFVDQNFGRSVELLTKAIDREPDFKLAYVSRGVAHMKIHHLEEARNAFDRAIQIDPTYARAHHLQGLVSEKTGDALNAEKDFDKALVLNPGYGAAYYSRATLHSRMGKHDAATEDIQMVTHLTEVETERFANENNIWRSRHLQRQSMLGDDSED